MEPSGSRRLGILAYHGIVGGPGIVAPMNWSRQHTIDAGQFGRQLDYIVCSASKTILTSCLDTAPCRDSVVITFDDGHSSDYTIAADALEIRQLSAVFFIPWYYLDQPGYLEKSQVRRLRARSFEIGSHGLTHRRLTHLSQEELWREVLHSKQRLEDLLGENVTTFALPYGAYNDFVLQAAWAAGYRRILTSDFGIANRQHHVMRRFSVLANMRFSQFKRIIDLNRGAVASMRVINGLKRRIGWQSTRIEPMIQH